MNIKKIERSQRNKLTLHIKELEKDCICPPGLPVCICDHEAKVKTINIKWMLEMNIHSL